MSSTIINPQQPIMPQLIVPNWAAPANVKAYSTTKIGGCSLSPFTGFNLAEHVGDDQRHVAKNRLALQQKIQHPANPLWLEQVHSDRVIGYSERHINEQADASFSVKPQQACLIMTADCLPVLFCSEDGDFVAAAHAGWRGLANNILLKTIACYHKPERLMAWVGPAISQRHFAVGEEVVTTFIANSKQNEQFFCTDQDNIIYGDLPAIAESQLNEHGVKVFKSNLCSYADNQQFYSYRRDGQTGRMASMIWLES